MKMINLDHLTAEELAAHREQLVAQVALERARLSLEGAGLRTSAHMVDKVRAGIGYLKNHPGILLLPGALVAVVGTRRVMSLVVGGIGIWRMVQKFRHRIRQPN